MSAWADDHRRSCPTGSAPPGCTGLRPACVGSWASAEWLFWPALLCARYSPRPGTTDETWTRSSFTVLKKLKGKWRTWTSWCLHVHGASEKGSGTGLLVTCSLHRRRSQERLATFEFRREKNVVHLLDNVSMLCRCWISTPCDVHLLRISGIDSDHVDSTGIETR
jgi:nitrite reductase/ring-hydroxylating ferredoxin subunit